MRLSLRRMGSLTQSEASRTPRPPFTEDACDIRAGVNRCGDLVVSDDLGPRRPAAFAFPDSASLSRAGERYFQK